MISQKHLHFLRRFIQMGPRTALWLLHHRIKKRYFIKKKSVGYISWQKLQQQHSLGSFGAYFQALAKKSFCSQILYDDEFITSLPNDLTKQETLLALADQACIPEIKILGYGSFTFQPQAIPWHQDFTTPQPSPAAWATDFFSDITIPAMMHHTLQERYPDIKVPWELSRFQHFFLLGRGHLQAELQNDSARLKQYADAFVHQTDDWLCHNPFLQGVNWTNPMEVAIRAINFIWAFHLFKHSKHIPQEFWERFICMLSDHAIYLEHTWEVGQKPNNHYIADLLGHLYLCSFLSDMPHFKNQRTKTIKKLIQQMQYQILPDGASYEGSSQYHKLVTEMMMHFLMLAKYTNITLPTGLVKTYAKMKQFLIDCTNSNGSMVLIGDDDSGKILAGFSINHTLKRAPAEDYTCKSYPNFGLSIIKTPSWHITFRHPTYQNFQPSGHFHQDMLSITVSIDSIPILVDPGTYVYTANAAWRNHLRSAAGHNTFFLTTGLAMPSDLFQLNCLPHPPSHDSDIFALQGKHHYYHNHGLRACRNVCLNAKNNILTITDWWEKIDEKPLEGSGHNEWALHFAPEITIKKENPTTWCVSRSGQRQPLALITTTREFVATQGLVSPEYGSIMQSTTLTASYPQIDYQQTITLKKL